MSDSIDLCNPSLDILKPIIIQETSLLEKHLLRFVCKKLHKFIHHISSFLSTNFHEPCGGACFRSCPIHSFEKLDELGAKCGNVHVFKWVVSTHCKGNSYKVCYNAARYGNNIELIKYIRSIGYSWDKLVCYGAVEGGNLGILKWARENNCPWDEHVCSLAAKVEHFEALARNIKMGQKKWLFLGCKDVFFSCFGRTF
jgi:hypothetical protein